MSAHAPRRIVACTLLVLLALPALGVVDRCAAQPRLTKVPGKRLSRALYTAPDAEFTLGLNEWLLPGARAEEQQVAASTRGVIFVDDFGGAYGVMRTVDAETLTVERIAEGFTVSDLLREKEIVTTSRGEELRLLGIDRGGSPMVIRTREGKEWSERKVDLFSAWSVFLDHGVMYRVTASVSQLEHESDALLFERAKRKLESMLAQLSIRPPGP